MAKRATTRPPTVDLTTDLNELARMAAAEAPLDDLLRRGLDGLAAVAPFDIAAVFLRDGDRLVLRASRGRLGGPTVAQHALDLNAFPSVREALESRRSRTFLESDHAHGDGDPFDGVLDLDPGHACMVAPLAAGDRTFGILTLDRERCEPYSEATLNVVDTYARVFSLALLNAERSATLARLVRQAADHAALVEADVLPPVVTGDADRTAAPAMALALRRAHQVASVSTPVLILGETGVGKERLARLIHHASPRRERPFVKINCAAIPAGLIESELFGHVKGAFSGATRDRAGRFQTANGGTLLLDEIGDLPPDLQAKLLRVLQDGMFEPVGADRTVKADVRVLAATHVDLDTAVQEKRFRADLYYRLSVFPIVVPPLRERLEDLAPLSQALLDEQVRRTGRRRMKLTPSSINKLRCHSWPGNVRELANVLERAVILTTGREISPSAIEIPGSPPATHPAVHPASHPPTVQPTVDPRSPRRTSPPRTLAAVEAAHIRDVLASTSGKLYGPDGAAAILGLKPSTLQSRMKKLGLTRR